MAGREGGNYMVFGRQNGPFSGVGPAVTWGDMHILYRYFPASEKLIEKIRLLVVHAYDDDLGDGWKCSYATLTSWSK